MTALGHMLAVVLAKLRTAVPLSAVQRPTNENFAGLKARKLSPDRFAELANFVEQSRQILAIAGLAAGVIEDGKALFAEGFGVRHMGGTEAVTPDVRFLIASNTKPLKSLLAAKLVDEGLVGWGTPSTALLPQLKLASVETSHKLQFRQFFCACTGLAYRNMDWEFAPNPS